MGRRIRWLGLVMIICFALVVIQLANIQFRRANALSHSSDNPVNQVPNYNNDRGVILAADGTVLAQSVRIAPSGAKTYQFQRQYPQGALYSQILGTNSPYFRDTGVEAYYDQQLGLHSHPAQTLSQLLSPSPPTVDNLTLTIDPTLQQTAENALNGLPGPNKDGSIVAIDPSTGAILAMYSTPTYDPTPLVSTSYQTQAQARSLYQQPDGEGFRPLYPLAAYSTLLPGSTAKVITTAAIYNLDPSLAPYNFPPTACLSNIPDTNLQICNDADTAVRANACGGTIVQMLPQSCDPGYAQLGLLLGGDNLAEQAALFGFNQRPPIDLPSGFVNPSIYPTAHDLSPSGTPGVPGQAYSAFGQQNVAATALQMALVAGAVANHGAVMAPHFLNKITDAQGGVVQTYQPRVWKQAMSAEAAAQIVPLMQAVATAPGATATGIFPPSLDVAVKTGTAQVGFPNVSSVSDWMIGFAPANTPKVAIAVVVPFQPLNTSGASVAGPIVRAMLQAAAG